MKLSFHSAVLEHTSVLATMNRELIRDEGHRNSMSLSELEKRMHEWLLTQYEAILVMHEDNPIGYALWKQEPDSIYVRQLWIAAHLRRRGIGQATIEWLQKNKWRSNRLRIDVLVHNHAAIAFWKALGFTDYCITMERAMPC